MKPIFKSTLRTSKEKKLRCQINSFAIVNTPEARRKITTKEFKYFIKLDPAWAERLTEPVEITDYCDMEGSKITHLSSLLHFSGRNHKGNAATFDRCSHLKIAEGKFAGLVDFSHSGVEKIGSLEITAPNKRGEAACFWSCNALSIAEGTFPGCVWFSESGVKEIGKLTITQPNRNGIKANFFGCDIRLPVEFLGSEYEIDGSTRQKILERIAAGNAMKATPDLEI